MTLITDQQAAEMEKASQEQHDVIVASPGEQISVLVLALVLTAAILGVLGLLSDALETALVWLCGLSLAVLLVLPFVTKDSDE